MLLIALTTHQARANKGHDAFCNGGSDRLFTQNAYCFSQSLQMTLELIALLANPEAASRLSWGF
ncbi:MAG: hypothetical protein HC879_15410 [Leptolyngbyaceae cyanobacterium SL_5_9]|nr:hypothetical protein [Leptolyngbyaceae cyanobacterium SL_5_9]